MEPLPHLGNGVNASEASRDSLNCPISDNKGSAGLQAMFLENLGV